eukprot:6306425-Amphidinium_carterae.2
MPTFGRFSADYDCELLCIERASALLSMIAVCYHNLESFAPLELRSAHPMPCSFQVSLHVVQSFVLAIAVWCSETVETVLPAQCLSELFALYFILMLMSGRDAFCQYDVVVW